MELQKAKKNKPKQNIIELIANLNEWCLKTINMVQIKNINKVRKA